MNIKVRSVVALLSMVLLGQVVTVSAMKRSRFAGSPLTTVPSSPRTPTAPLASGAATPPAWSHPEHAQGRFSAAEMARMGDKRFRGASPVAKRRRGMGAESRFSFEGFAEELDEIVPEQRGVVLLQQPPVTAGRRMVRARQAVPTRGLQQEEVGAMLVEGVEPVRSGVFGGNGAQTPLRGAASTSDMAALVEKLERLRVLQEQQGLQ